jgi:hypothetical protein
MNGAAIGQERDAVLPMGKRTLCILEIHKASTPSYSAVNGSAVSWPSIPDMRKISE